MARSKEDHDARSLFEALAGLKAADEVAAFLADIATPKEVAAFAERWRIARMLDAGEQSYREIAAATGASTATIVRVARFLRNEPHRGYRRALDRLQKKKA